MTVLFYGSALFAILFLIDMQELRVVEFKNMFKLGVAVFLASACYFFKGE
jgi:hypothetical protein